MASKLIQWIIKSFYNLDTVWGCSILECLLRKRRRVTDLYTSSSVVKLVKLGWVRNAAMMLLTTVFGGEKFSKS
jgi:hypothetical protein